MAEIYKLINEFRADIKHKRTGEIIDYKGRVYEGPNTGRFYIEHSHVLRPSEGAGFWYSDSFTSAESADGAELLVRNWIEMLADSYEVKLWRV